MPELLLELFSEEIPARMQARGGETLSMLVEGKLKSINPQKIRTFPGPRRIALAAEVRLEVPPLHTRKLGPRTSAPEQAVAGFLRKNHALAAELREEGGYFVLEQTTKPQSAADVVARELTEILWRFVWPKSMRWGGTSAFTWVRPLRRILCILDGDVVPFDLRQGEDDGHGLRADTLTEGHRFLSPGTLAVRSVAEWETRLRERHVIVDAAERRRLIESGLAGKAAELNLSVMPDEGLLAEVAGLVEWPVPLIGRIDTAYMDLPPEVMQVSMRVNQRYFALRDRNGNVAPHFAFVANIEATDGGAAIIAGNERVLRARFSDARHFWDVDRRTRLADRVAALDTITFHAKLGSQGDRVRRLVQLAGEIAPLVGADVAQARRAALLAKADLTTGMVGEFPELQGVMGGYYARHDGEDRAVWEAVRDHYAPRGPDDDVPHAPVTVATALADKLDQLVQFFAAGEKPTGSGDPFALRRAALGILRILQENRLDSPLRRLLHIAGAGAKTEELLGFLKERLRVSWRSEGRRHDVLAAAFANDEDSITDLLARTDALSGLIGDSVGTNLLSGYRRAANILQIENRKDGPHTGDIDAVRLEDPAEKSLAEQAFKAASRTNVHLQDANFSRAMDELAQLREPLDTFFARVTVNSPQPEIRRNRLRLLASVVEIMNRVADFSKIEG